MTNTASEKLLAQQLAERGEEMNLEISSDQEYLLRTFHGCDYFSVAIANAFTWTGHAVTNDTFFEYAIDYLTTGNLASLKRTEDFSGRFGPERLVSALKGWKAIAKKPLGQDIMSGDAPGLCKIQDERFNNACKLLSQRKISGVGPWFFCAPFKIVASHRKDLWQSEALDELWMPLGLEVVRGVRRLIHDGCTYAQELDVSMLYEEEGGLEEGMATVILIQGMSKSVAQICSTRVLHINSGLYLHGRGEL